MRSVHALAAAVLLLLPACDLASAAEPKQGGILKIYHRDSPASMSIHEEATFSVVVPIMAVFNNLVMFDQHVPQNSLDIDRARSRRRAGRGARTATKLTFKLRQGVKWHDGKPFTAADVKCTWDLLQGKAQREAAASTRASPGTAMSTRSRPTATTRSPST